jgi:uncharacterized alkaline shock family protein YloU
MESGERTGRVTIAPGVLNTIVRLTTLSCPGVARILTDWRDGVSRILGIHAVNDGIRVQVEGNSVSVDVHVIAAPNVNMLALGRAIQEAVARAIQDTVGMVAREINVHIEDVDRSSTDERGAQGEDQAPGQDRGSASTFRDR